MRGLFLFFAVLLLVTLASAGNDEGNILEMIFVGIRKIELPEIHLFSVI